jgi:hypothetical protein
MSQSRNGDGVVPVPRFRSWDPPWPYRARSVSALERLVPTCQIRPYPIRIEQMRVQVSRQRGEILEVQRAGINSLPAEALMTLFAVPTFEEIQPRAG